MYSPFRLLRLAFSLLTVLYVTLMRTGPSTAPATREPVSAAAIVANGHDAEQKARRRGPVTCLHGCRNEQRLPRRVEAHPARGAAGRLERSGHHPSPDEYVLLPHSVAGSFGVGAFVAQRSSDVTALTVGRLRLLGAQWVREEFTASALHSGPGQPYNWTAYDRAVNAERRAGIRVLGLLDYSDTWSFRRHNVMPHRSIERLSADFARFASAVVRHFRGRIQFWQVWNEPDLTMFWQPTPDAADYALLLHTAYRSIKSANPTAQVVLAGTSGVDLGFLHAIVRHTHSFDILSVHPYRNLPEDQLLSEIHSLHSFGRPLWFSEIGWAAGGGCDICDGEADQASYLVRFYTLSLAAGVQRIFWYDFRDDPNDPASPEAHFGLVRRDLSGKPAFAAYEVLAHLLANASFRGIDLPDQQALYALRFQSGGNPIVVAWNNGTEPATIAIPWPAAAARVLNLDGSEEEEIHTERGQLSWAVPPGGVPAYLVAAPQDFFASPPGPLLHFTPPIRHVRRIARRVPPRPSRARVPERRTPLRHSIRRLRPSIPQKPAARTAGRRQRHPLRGKPQPDPRPAVTATPTPAPSDRQLALPSPTPTATDATPTPLPTASPTTLPSPTPTPSATPTAP